MVMLESPAFKLAADSQKRVYCVTCKKLLVEYDMACLLRYRVGDYYRALCQSCTTELLTKIVNCADLIDAIEGR